jgi:hypothetical protein
MSTIAFATTASNTLGADPGITISDYDPAGAVHVDLINIDGDPGEDEDGDLDIDNADAILASHGWSRIGQWTRSGGQWGAEIERQQEENPR